MNALITFKAGFASNNDVIAHVLDADGSKSAWTGIGTWTASFLNQPPAVTSVSPSSGSGLTQTFTAIYNDPNGVGNISSASLAIGPKLSSGPLCYVYYVTNWFYLVDPGNGSVGPLKAGPTGSLTTPECTL